MTADGTGKPENFEDVREHFRLRYPESERPRLLTAHGAFAVSELSEAGMRLYLHLDHWEYGPSLQGSINLDGEEVEIEGQYLRDCTQEEVAFQLTKGVTMRHMMQEQKRLIRKYPALYGRG